MITLNTQTEPSDDDDNVPPPHILAWCRKFVSTIADGGSWGIPRSQIVFRVDQKKKQLVLVIGNTTDPDFVATKHVFKHIGWDVVPEDKTND
jgi:hypothetical protein